MYDGMDDRFKDPDARHDKGTKIAVVLIVCSVLFSLSLAYFIVPVPAEDTISEETSLTIYDVSEIRELEVLREVPVRYQSRRDYQRMMDLWDHSFTMEERVLLDVLFLFDIGSDPGDIYAERHGEAVGGYYIPYLEVIYIIEGTGEVTERVILAHEFTHALQDQHFFLDSYRYGRTLDRELTRKAVLEGDAVFTQYEYLFSLSPAEFDKYMEELEERRSKIESELPYGLENILYFPYVQGYQFVNEVHARGGWEAVNRLYTDRIPMSTEHILHIDKYFQGERPLEIEWIPTVEGMDVVYTYTVGEFHIYTMLGHFLDEDTAYQGAKGWGGDKLYYFEDGDDFVSIFVIEWDDREEAVEFFAIYNMWQNSLDGIFRERLDDGTLSIDLQGNTTTIYYSNLVDLPEIY